MHSLLRQDGQQHARSERPGHKNTDKAPNRTRTEWCATHAHTHTADRTAWRYGRGCLLRAIRFDVRCSTAASGGHAISLLRRYGDGRPRLTVCALRISVKKHNHTDRDSTTMQAACLMLVHFKHTHTQVHEHTTNVHTHTRKYIHTNRQHNTYARH